VNEERAVQRDEIDLKGRFWNSETVNARLRGTFPVSELAVASVVLSELVGEDPSGDAAASDFATCRLMLAALKLSEGDLMRLALWVEAGRRDPRDLIGAAEYPRESRGGGAEREIDLAEYLNWVAGADLGDALQ
jgi:hypothetical protein